MLLRRPVIEQSDIAVRVSCEVDGLPIWFESSDTVLEPSVEAFAGVLLLPCLHHGIRLTTDSPVDSRWIENIRQLCQIYATWWGYDTSFPIEAVTQTSSQTSSSAAGLCFTGGVDSFYSLHEYSEPIEYLVFAHGYDIPLKDVLRIKAYRQSLADIAAQTGKKAIIIRTNLREHPFFNSVSWDRTHGSALAALGLLLSNQIGRLVIPPSYASTRLRPWGSHPETDKLFSSANCQITHHSTQLGRLERIQAIANHDLVHKNLRVCGANIKLTRNCSICEKCVMTMTALSTTGQLEHCKTFSLSNTLTASIDKVDHVSPHTVMIWQDIANSVKDPALKKAIHKAIWRSKRPLRYRLSLRLRKLLMAR